MRAGTIILLSIVLCLFPLVVAGVTPDDVNITNSSNWPDNPYWVLAGGSYTSTLTVKIINTSLNSGLLGVELSCENGLGVLNRTGIQNVSINSGDGFINYRFTPGTKSGDAIINITLINLTTGQTYWKANWPTIIQIDHNVPKYFGDITFDNPVTVAKDADISVQLKDMYGNLIDNKRVHNEYSENVTFLDGIEGNSTFWDGSHFPAVHIHQYPKTVDENGFATITYRVPPQAGENVIQINAPSGVISNQTRNNYSWITITGLPGDPKTLTSIVQSTTGTYQGLADGIDKFSIYYTVVDDYSNPVPGAIIFWNTDIGESKQFTTNYQGLVYLEYGPSTQIHNVTMNASNASTNRVSDILSFVLGGPTQFIVYSNPSIIASLETKDDSVAFLRARITDNLGRPITGITVNFTIQTEDTNQILLKGSSFNKTSPQLQISESTNAEGYAIVLFYPGQFPDYLNKSYKADAEGTATIRAEWYNFDTKTVVSDETQITYKNYPFLRAVTNISPSTVEVGNTTTLTITLIGDGISPHRPIDVVMCDSRGESMLGDLYAFQGQTGTINDKEVWAQKAIWNFTYQFAETDRIGLVSFGNIGEVNALDGPSSGGYAGPDTGNDTQKQDYANTKYMVYPTNYSDYATVDIPLANVTDDIRYQILTTNVTPSKLGIGGGGRREVPTRYGLYMALKELATTPSSGNTVKAVVLLLDDQRSGWGDPLASGGCTEYDPNNQMTCADWSQGKSGEYCAFSDLGGCGDPRQNLATYANSMNVIIFTILLPQKGCQMNSATEEEAQAIAHLSGGEHYNACSAIELDKWYQDIAMKLKKYASVDTEMDLILMNVTRTYQNVTYTNLTGMDVFEYVPLNGTSTNISSWNLTADPIIDKLHVPPYPGDAIPGPVNGNITYPYTINQSDDWADNRLDFYIGNMTIGQTWQATLLLRAIQPGLISMFGNRTNDICYETEDGDDFCISIPPLSITAVYNMTYPGKFQNQLDIIDGSINATPDEPTDLANITWILNYTGDLTVIQHGYYQYSPDGKLWPGNWIYFGSNITGGQNLDHSLQYLLMDIRDKTGNTQGYIKFMIKAFEIAPGGSSDEEISSPYALGVLRAKIRIS